MMTIIQFSAAVSRCDISAVFWGDAIEKEDTRGGNVVHGEFKLKFHGKLEFFHNNNNANNGERMREL